MQNLKNNEARQKFTGSFKKKACIIILRSCRPQWQRTTKVYYASGFVCANGNFKRTVHLIQTIMFNA